jgi:hypothetical protein
MPPLGGARGRGRGGGRGCGVAREEYQRCPQSDVSHEGKWDVSRQHDPKGILFVAQKE